MRVMFTALYLVIAVTLPSPGVGAIASTPASLTDCEVFRPLEAFVEAWNTGSPDLVPTFYDGLTLITGDPNAPEGPGSIDDPAAFVADRPAASDFLALATHLPRSLHPSGRDREEWIYVMQPVVRSVAGSEGEGYELVAPIHCLTGTFGVITVHPRDDSVVIRDATTDRDTRCTDRTVHQPLRTLLNAIREKDSESIGNLLYKPAGAGTAFDIARLGEYSLMTPGGDILRKGDAQSFSSWMVDHLGHSWTLSPMHLSWHPTEGDLAEVQYFFLMVEDSTGEAYQGIWKGIAIDCATGTILSLHGGYA